MSAPPVIIRGGRPLTTTYAPPLPPFFRPRRSTRPGSTSSSEHRSASASTSFVSDSDSSDGDEQRLDDDDNDDSEDDTTSDPYTDDDDTSSGSSDAFSVANYLPGAWRPRLRGFASAKASPITVQPSTSTSTNAKSIASHGVMTPSRAHLRLSLALLRVRQALASSSFDSLLTAVRSLAASLSPSTIPTLGVFIPILDRLAYDLEQAVAGDQKGKDYRRELGSLDAKALVALRQRWAPPDGQGGGSKAKAKDSDHDWAATIRVMAKQHEPTAPECLKRPHDAKTAAVLTALESLLLPSSLPRVNLANLAMTSEQLAALEPLRNAEPVLEWYLSFHPAQETRPKARSILDSVTSLDLSKNKLNSEARFESSSWLVLQLIPRLIASAAFPPDLHEVFPSLETLSISNNQFRHIPSTITLFSSLRRLRRHGNLFGKPRRRRLSTTDAKHGDSRSRLIPPGGTHSNTRSMVELILTRRGDPSASTTERSRVATLSSLCIRILHQHIPFFESASSQSLLSTLPSHLHETVLSAYACASCDRFLSPLGPDAPDHLPPLFERVHHLDPGVSLPSHQPPQSPAAPRRPSPPAPNSSARMGGTPRPTTPPSPRAVPASSRYLLTLEERVLLALYGRSTQLHTLVIGDTRRHRFCLACAALHLGVDEYSERVVEDKCACKICKEERRVKGEEGRGAAAVMRWLRRKAPRSAVLEAAESGMGVATI